MASLALKINWKQHKNRTVSCVVSTGTHPSNMVYSGDLSMSEEAFSFFKKTIEVGAMALNGVTHLEINEVLENESTQL